MILQLSRMKKHSGGGRSGFLRKDSPVIDEALEVYQYVSDRDIEALKKKFNNHSELNRESRNIFQVSFSR